MNQTLGTGAEVRLEGIAKRYGKVEAVKPLDLVIEGGSLVTLLGPSGCGKTTLLRMIAGLEQPSAGRISIGGRDVTLLSAGERNVSMVFQSYALFPHMSVRENVAYGLGSSGMGKKEAAERAEAALDRLFHQILAWKGANTGEHGIGIAKKRWWRHAVSPAAHETHLRLKAALDPNGILNPGKFLD